jgi:ParB family transcriptional regulator, chromosome partitioning protein
MSKQPRKSIVANFGLLSAEIDSEPVVDQLPVPSPPAVNRVGAGVVGATHRALDDIKLERDRLRALVESGGAAVRELDPALIDPSPYPDRLPDDDSASFEEFKRSIDAEGQKIPIQVRKHPTSSGRFQVVYGHRRWLAAKHLGRPVRALEVELDDLDLVLVQGIENANRQDLTWIERALFASRMDNAGIKPRHIYAALSIEDAELARMRSVYRVIPADVIEAIGRAPKIGRPRWLDMAKTIAGNPNSLAAIRDALGKKGESIESSDQRFQRILSVIKPTSPKSREPIPIEDRHGMRLGALVMSSKEVRISAEGTRGVEFLKFIKAELRELAERFDKRRDQ